MIKDHRLTSGQRSSIDEWSKIDQPTRDWWQERHAAHYLIVNLCSERSYLIDTFHGNSVRYHWQLCITIYLHARLPRHLPRQQRPVRLPPPPSPVGTDCFLFSAASAQQASKQASSSTRARDLPEPTAKRLACAGFDQWSIWPRASTHPRTTFSMAIWIGGQNFDQWSTTVVKHLTSGQSGRRYPFPDHNPPALELMLPCCATMHKFLQASPRRPI